MSTDVKGSKILARTFFNQLRSSGYTPNQIIGIATELIDLVTNDLREDKNLAATQAQDGVEARPQA
ncbi:MAG: hypothetical protein M3Y59_08505 [Myxococcota bacterium]|nr:hypothetical protein [Myxococcota bacterium]